MSFPFSPPLALPKDFPIPFPPLTQRADEQTKNHQSLPFARFIVRSDFFLHLCAPQILIILIFQSIVRRTFSISGSGLVDLLEFRPRNSSSIGKPGQFLDRTIIRLPSRSTSAGSKTATGLLPPPSIRTVVF
uniref:Uncharacterized protein n=1 Tax=Leersia perrieri TaxID=77586 RepID=A0A0D9WQA7_9ORYZ